MLLTLYQQTKEMNVRTSHKYKVAINYNTDLYTLQAGMLN